jgi:hypothetical protein
LVQEGVGLGCASGGWRTALHLQLHCVASPPRDIIIATMSHKTRTSTSDIYLQSI